MSGSTKAPDGIAWPQVHVAVARNEQIPWCLGHKPAVVACLDCKRGNDTRASQCRYCGGRLIPHEERPIHDGIRDPSSLVNLLRGGPFVTHRATLHTGDYWLARPDGTPIEGPIVIERKERDLEASLTVGHARLEAEFRRMSAFARRRLVLSCDLTSIINRDRSRGRTTVQNIVANIVALTLRYNVPYDPMPDRATAESMGAWALKDTWRDLLAKDGPLLAEVRLWEANERAQGRSDMREVPVKRARRAADPVLPGDAPRIDVPAYMTAAESRESKARSV